MKQKRFMEEQVISRARETEAGVAVVDPFRKHGMSGAGFRKYRAKYSGMEVSDARKLRQLESENRRPNWLLANAMPDKPALEVLLLTRPSTHPIQEAVTVR